jgi:hypothetical protein
VLRVDRDPVRQIREPEYVDVARRICTSELRERTSDPEGLRDVEERGRDDFVVLEDAPLDILFDSQFTVPVDFRRLEPVDEQARGLVQDLESVTKFAGSDRIASVYGGVKSCAARPALEILVLPSEEEELVRVHVSQAGDVFDKRAKVGDRKGRCLPDRCTRAMLIELRRESWSDLAQVVFAVWSLRSEYGAMIASARFDCKPRNQARRPHQSRPPILSIEAWRTMVADIAAELRAFENRRRRG